MANSALHPNRASHEHGALIAPVLFPILFVGLSVLRGWRMANGVGTYTSCHTCFWLPTFGHDAWLLAALLGVLATACLAPWRWLGFLLRLLAALALIFFAADIALDALLSQRLFLGDVLRFGKHVDANFSVVSAGLWSLEGMERVGIVLSAACVAIGVCWPRRRSTHSARLLAIGAIVAGLFSAYALSRPVRYVNQLYTYNVVESNLPQGRLKTFSPAFIDSQRRVVDAMPKTCARSSPASSANVILLLVESLSAWQSKLLGSPFDWTPKLDAIARDNHYFTHFYANGFTTGGAEIAITTGNTSLIPAGSIFFDYSTYSNLPDTLADVAHRSGRQAGYFTAQDLSFLGENDWLHNLRFDVVNGGADPFYNGMTRWQFGAAEDAALYDRYLDWLDKRTDRRPFISMLLTISTHPPFVDPRSANIDPEGAFGYADVQIDRFYNELKQRGFFKDGVLLILGDHRTMTPLRKREFRTFGERAFARIPMIVAGAVNMPAKIDAPFQQTDVKASIADFLGLETCTSPFTGHFLRGDPQPPAYVLHARGDDRNRVDVYWDDEISGFHYDGDRSAWLDKQPPDAGMIAAWINTHRHREPAGTPQ